MFSVGSYFDLCFTVAMNAARLMTIEKPQMSLEKFVYLFLPILIL